jgi:hypothetical protein
VRQDSYFSAASIIIACLPADLIKPSRLTHEHLPKENSCSWKQDHMLEEEKLIEKLKRIEALFARPATEGERAAAANALERIKARLRELEKVDPAVEYRFSLSDPWSHRLLIALMRRYGITPYRYRGQRRTTIMVKASRRFIEETLMPEFEQFQSTLVSYFEEVTQRVLSAALSADNSDAEER